MPLTRGLGQFLKSRCFCCAAGDHCIGNCPCKESEDCGRPGHATKACRSTAYAKSKTWCSEVLTTGGMRLFDSSPVADRRSKTPGPAAKEAGKVSHSVTNGLHVSSYTDSPRLGPLVFEERLELSSMHLGSLRGLMHSGQKWKNLPKLIRGVTLIEFSSSVKYFGMEVMASL